MGELRRAAVSFFVAVCLFGMAALFYFSGSTLFMVVSVIPALLGLLVVYAGIHAIFASATPPTTISLDKEPLIRGQSVGVVISQTGPVQFESLRANLICEHIVKPIGRSRTITYPCQDNFFDSGPCEVPRLDEQKFHAHVTVPADAEPSRDEAGLTIEWRIEVWGKVLGRADFMRPFVIEVI